MLSPQFGELKEVKRKIQHHIEELEIKIKNSKTYWNNCEFNFDNKFVFTFIDRHYNEIIHHLAEIKHHLEEINYHKKELEEVKENYLITSSEPIKRINEETQKLKNLRSSRSASSKYVYKWEKIIEEQKRTPQNEIKHRLKGGGKIPSETSKDMSQTMVKNRVMLFETNKTTKRASSTIDAFLDFCLEKPPREVDGLDGINESAENEKRIGDNFHICDVNTLKINPSEDIFTSCLDIQSTNEDDCVKGNCEDVFISCTDIGNEVSSIKIQENVEKLIQQKHMKDIVEDKSIITESKLELLDDVNALLEDDHLKIIKKEKQSNKKIVNAEKEEEKKGADFLNISIKPRIVELHMKKNLHPDIYF